jgi:hypothetical protein
MKTLIIHSKQYHAFFDDQNYEWTITSQRITVKTKDGKRKLVIPKEAVYYIMEVDS